MTFLCAPFIPINLARSGDPRHRTPRYQSHRGKTARVASLGGQSHSDHLPAPQRLMVATRALAAQAWTMHTLFTPIPDRDMNPQRPAGGFSLSGHEPETRVAPLINFKGYNQNVRKHRFCSSYPPGIWSPNDIWTFWKEGTHGNGARRLCEGNNSSSELALLILVAFTKRTPSYADTPSCSSGNLVKVHLANHLHPPERTKATPLAVHHILVDVEAVCGVSRLAEPSPRSLAQHKGEIIGVEKKQRL
ncbi:hypothetical protein DFH09DRAFT_1092290 [Mycena vulgaris]|nr:hypothetical protein DFH09DRAFT_1092290 [Mycena vulgaris]